MDSDVRRRIRQLREDKGMTQEALAEAAGISRDALARIERGERTPRVATLQALTEALEISFSLLMTSDLPPEYRPHASLESVRLKRVQRALASVPDEWAERIVRAVVILCAARPERRTATRRKTKGSRTRNAP